MGQSTPEDTGHHVDTSALTDIRIFFIQYSHSLKKKFTDYAHLREGNDRI
jgi:hypothetical protein